MPHAQTPNPSISFSRLTSADGAEFEGLYAIYEEAIPASERKTRAQMRAMTANASYRIVVAALYGKVAGFSTLYFLKNPNFVLLEYMAVDASMRGRGIGSSIFRESARLLQEELGDAPMIIEIDSDREESMDRPKRLQRIAFYRALDCRRLEGVDYILPLDTGEKPPVMDLFIWRRSKTTSIEKNDLRHYLRQIYVEVYSCSPDDPRIYSMLKGLDLHININ